MIGLINSLYLLAHHSGIGDGHERALDEKGLKKG